jgi:hypothetical protein
MLKMNSLSSLVLPEVKSSQTKTGNSIDSNFLLDKMKNELAVSMLLVACVHTLHIVEYIILVVLVCL